MNNEEYLKECPFCRHLGAKIMHEDVFGGNSRFCYVQCLTCFAQGPQTRLCNYQKSSSYSIEKESSEKCEKEAVSYWNKSERW